MRPRCVQNVTSSDFGSDFAYPLCVMVNCGGDADDDDKLAGASSPEDGGRWRSSTCTR